MPEVKTTENEFRGKVITWLNARIAQGGTPFEQATEDPSIRTHKGEHRLPDVQLWRNRQAQQGICGLELKTPTTPVDHQELLENAAEKARAMKADFFVTWNMRDTVIWRTPPDGNPVSREHRVRTYRSIFQVTKVEDLWDRFKSGLLEYRASEVLDDLATLFHEGHLHLVETDSTFFVKLLADTAKELRPYIQESLAVLASKDSRFRATLQEWAIKQCMTNYGDPAFEETVARQIVYRLLGKIIFYHTLRRHFSTRLPAMEISEPTPEAAQQRLKWFFEQAQQIDYQAVFIEDVPDRVPIPKPGFHILVTLIEDLNRYNFSRMPLDVVGKVFEELIPPSERHTLGQYFTPEDLVDFILAFCVRQPTDFVLDPTCGTGTFLIRAYDRLKMLGEHNHKKLLSQLWGVDIAPFPAELATINLYRQNLADYTNVPKILARDAFDVREGQIHSFPLPKPGKEKEPSMIEVKLPAFDAAVGNFPFIRQELLNRYLPGYKDKLERLLAEEWSSAFGRIGRVIEVSGQADIYVYLFFHTAKLLKEGGRMGIITSNAWLDVAYGHALQQFFLRHFKLIAVVESRCEPWFEDSAVNTVFTILEPCSSKEERDNNLVNFVKVKKRLKELIPWNMQFESNLRWRNLERMTMQTTSAGRKLLKLEGSKVVSTLKGHQTFEDEDFRIRVLTQRELLEDVEQAKKAVKWGLYLRAPELYFQILEKAKDKFVHLYEVADIRFGIKTGINDFFYPDADQVKHWKIEAEFLTPVFKSPRETEGKILVDSSRLKTTAFVCRKSKAELRKKGCLGALKYIEWGEQQSTEEGVPWPQVPSVQNRKPGWWALPEETPVQIFWSKAYDIRHLQRFSEQPLLCDCRIYFVSCKKGIDPKMLAAILNSSLCSLFLELIGRVSLGEGALDVMVEDAKEYMLVPDLAVSKDAAIIKAFDQLLKRPIKPTSEEVKEKDRQQLDSLVLQAIGLNPRQYLNPLHQGLCELVNERLVLSKARQKVKQIKVKRDVDKLKEQVIQEVLPDGAKQFPEHFFDRTLNATEFSEISVPGDPLRLDTLGPLFPKVISDKGYSYEAKNEYEARYIIYAQKPNAHIIRLPKQSNAITQIVLKYERYLRKLKSDFFKSFCDRTRDAKLADTFTQHVFEELGLPELSNE